MASPPPNVTRNDPIRAKYYRPLETAEAVASWLFYVAAILSFAPLAIARELHPTLYSLAVIAFVVAVAGLFAAGVASRLHYFPRAEDARRQEFLSTAFDFNLIHQRTTGYYNNPEKDPDRRLGLMVLENVFFTKAILQDIAPKTRLKVSLYFLVWLTIVVWRDTPIDWVATAAQALFSEEILMRWFRLEWARARSERIYEATHRLFQSRPSPDRLRAFALEAFGEYETGKAVSSILLPQKVFDRLNPQLTAEWDVVQKGLSLPAP